MQVFLLYYPHMKSSIILIDGSNFYFKLKSLGVKNQLEFDYYSFNIFLSKQSKLVSSTYYVGKVKTDKTKKSKKLHKNQQKLLQHLKGNKVKYKLGFLMKSGKVFHEKGVDVQIAVDLLVAAYENKAEHIILVSSDTDLIPSIRKAQSMGKIVEYIGFSHQKSIALIAECKESRLLKIDDLEDFIKDKK